MHIEERPSSLRPEEVQTVQHIFKQIKSETWFSQDPERQQKFGAFLLRAYQSGIIDSSALYDLAVRTARERFANKPVKH